MATTTSTKQSQEVYEKTDNSARASHFSVHFFTVLYDYDVKLPTVTSYGGSKHIEMRSFNSFLNLERESDNTRRIRQHFSSLEPGSLQLSLKDREILN